MERTVKAVKTTNTGRNEVENTVVPSKHSSTPNEKFIAIIIVSIVAYFVALVFAGVFYSHRNSAKGTNSESEVFVSEVSGENSRTMHESEETSQETSEETSAEEVSEETSEAKYSAIKNKAQNFHFAEKIEDVSDKEIDLLARVIMCESSVCNILEKYYVGNVIINRVISPDFPNNIEDVIYQIDENGAVQYASVDVLFDDTPTQEYYSIARNILFGGVRVLDDNIVFQTGYCPDWATVVFRTEWHYYSKSKYDDSEDANQEESVQEEAYSEDVDSDETYSEDVDSEEAYSEDVDLDETYSEHVDSEEAYSEEAYSEEAYSEEAYSEETANEEN